MYLKYIPPFIDPKKNVIEYLKRNKKKKKKLFIYISTEFFSSEHMS